MRQFELPLLPYTTLFRSIYVEHAGRAGVFTVQDKDSLEVLADQRSEEHTSELQSRFDLVCRLLLEKKNSVATCDDKSDQIYARFDKSDWHIQRADFYCFNEAVVHTFGYF